MTEPAPKPTPQRPSDRAVALRIVGGFGLGLVLTALVVVLVSLVPVSLPEGTQFNMRLYDTEPGNGVRVSFIETGHASAPGWLLQQGGGLGSRPVVYRAALIEHPDGNLLFGTGIGSVPPPSRVFDPFGAPRDAGFNADIPPVARIVLPTPRWLHIGGAVDVPALADVPVLLGRSDRWQSGVNSPWPGRYGMHPSHLAAIGGDRLQNIPYERRSRLGMRHSVDLTDDGAVVAVALRGSSIDETALLVTLDSGRRILLVGDALWTQEQVQTLEARSLWSTWLFDRNRMQLAGTQARLYQAWDRHDLEILPLLDGTLDLPVYPERWE